MVESVGPNDNLYDRVTKELQGCNLTPGTDRITKVIIVGHGSTLGSLGTLSGGASDITLDSLRTTGTPQLRLMNYLNPWTSGHCDVTLRACFQAVQGPARDMMALMAQLLGANVTGWDDEYAVHGWGNQWTVDSKGNWTMKKGKPFKGSWTDMDSWSAFWAGFSGAANWLGF
jgi:hypothetical protein